MFTSLFKGAFVPFAVLTAVAAGSTAAHAGGPQINFPTFANAGSLSLNGTAGIVSAGNAGHQTKVLRLTGLGYRQAGSAWAAGRIDVTRSFDTTFVAYLHHGKTGADGIAFVLQTTGPRALGGWGGGIGYRGIRPSVAVEFDDFRNKPDPDGNHVGLVLHGNPDYHAATAEPQEPLFGAPFRARIAYEADVHDLKVYVTQWGDESEQLVLDETVDLADTLGTTTAYAGFSGSTGDVTSKQDINSWKLTTY